MTDDDTQPESELAVGDSVIDREDDDPNEAIVVWRPEDRTITDWQHETDDGTVTTADDNPAYSEDEPLVVVVYRSGLDDAWSDWQQTDASDLYEGTGDREINQYGFPEGRLQAIEPGELEAQWLDGLAERLADAGWDVTRNPTELAVEQFGDTYRVTKDGSVEGEGEYRSPLETLIENYRD
jgi:hypothetical protein